MARWWRTYCGKTQKPQFEILQYFPAYTNTTILLYLKLSFSKGVKIYPFYLLAFIGFNLSFEPSFQCIGNLIVTFGCHCQIKSELLASS